MLRKPELSAGLIGHLACMQTLPLPFAKKNKNIIEIVRILAEDECQISHLGVRRFLTCFQERQSLENAPLPGRPTVQVPLEVMNFIDTEMDKDDE